jgi:hypothetical protein
MWSDDVRRRGASQPPVRVTRAWPRARVLQAGAAGTAVKRTPWAAGVRPSRHLTLSPAAPPVPQQRRLGARQPRITLHLAGSMEQADREPPDRARTEPPIPSPAAAHSRQPGGEPEWSPPHDAVEIAGSRVASEPAPNLFVVACAVAAVGLIAVIAYVVTRHSGSARDGGALPPSPHARTLSTPVQQAETWLAANVAADTPLCADRAVVAQLGKAGFTALDSCRPDASLDHDRFIVSTPDIRTAIAHGLAAIVGQRASLAVAVFGTGAERVEVRMVVPGAQSALSARLTRDLHERALAAAALLHNPRVTLSAGARAALRRGELDMRAATLLALLTARIPVRVDTVMTRPPEAAAGLPARSIAVSVSDPAALTATARLLTGDYVPALVTTAGNGTRLDWPVGLAPNAGVG